VSRKSRKKTSRSAARREQRAAKLAPADAGARSSVGGLVALGLVVAVVVAGVHWPALSAEALCFEDHKHAVRNPLVQKPGIESIGRVLGEVLEPSAGGYYKPLAFLSLMGDAAFGGREDNLRPFRRTSLVLHVINTLLVMVLLHELFGQRMVVAMLALLYGVHPLTVESIPWAAERKNLLAAFFVLWALVFYARYARHGGRWSFAAVLACYVLALMSKPTATTLPGLLLLLDYWPLRRLNGRAVLEKVPLFVIGAISAAITFISQARAAAVTLPTEHSPWQVPLVVCHNIIFYLSKIVWPSHLTAHYPHPEPMGLSHPMVLAGVIGTGLLIVGLAISLRWTRALAVGWLFFFVAIFPALGVVGFMIAIAADRFVYLPVVGLLLPAGWLLGRAWSAWGRRPDGTVRRIAVVVVVLLLATAESVATRRYLTTWRDTETLYTHMLAEAPNAAIVHYSLGHTYETQGRLVEAEARYRKALQLRSEYLEAHYSLGVALMMQGKLEEAIEHYREALRLSPDFMEARNNLAGVLAETGQVDEAVEQYELLVRSAPEVARVRVGFGQALIQQGRMEEAVGQLRQAVRIEPGYADAWYELGRAAATGGRIDEAISHFRRAVGLAPAFAAAHSRLGLLLTQRGELDAGLAALGAAVRIDPRELGVLVGMGRSLRSQGRLREAEEVFREGVRSSPDDSGLRFLLGDALEAQGRNEEAAEQYRQVLRLDPDHAEARRRLSAGGHTVDGSRP